MLSQLSIVSLIYTTFGIFLQSKAPLYPFTILYFLHTIQYMCLISHTILYIFFLSFSQIAGAVSVYFSASTLATITDFDNCIDTCGEIEGWSSTQLDELITLAKGVGRVP